MVAEAQHAEAECLDRTSSRKRLHRTPSSASAVCTPHQAMVSAVMTGQEQALPKNSGVRLLITASIAAKAPSKGNFVGSVGGTGGAVGSNGIASLQCPRSQGIRQFSSGWAASERGTPSLPASSAPSVRSRARAPGSARRLPRRYALGHAGEPEPRLGKSS